LARAKAKSRSIGETDPPKRRKRYVTVEQLRKIVMVIDEKIRALWSECLDIRHGKEIEQDAGELEKKLKIK
jgi:hypothetical protein